MFDARKLAKEVFSTLRSFDYEVAMFDEEGNRVYEPKDAVRFFTNKRNITVSIDDENEDSTLRLIVGRSVELPTIKGLVDSLRSVCNKYALLVNVRKYKRDIQPRDFAQGTIVEGRARLDGSTKSSYLKLKGARMILRHGQAIDESKLGARSRNVEKVIIENSDGERLLMPSTNLSAGRAMTRHVSEGNHWNDETGQLIIEVAGEQAKLRTCLKYCRSNRRKLDYDVKPLIEDLRGKLSEMRKLFEGVYGNYSKNVKRLAESRHILVEDDALEDRIDELKQKLQLEDEEVMDRETCETVARHADANLFEGRAKKVEMMPLPKLGCEVSVAGWEDFKKGRIELIAAPNIPQLGPTANETVIRLQAIAGVCKDDSMANLLGRVADDLDLGNGDALRNRIAEVAILATQHNAAEREDGRGYVIVESDEECEEEKVEVAESFFADTSSLILSESVREFGDWMDSLSIERIFESDMDEDEHLDGDVEAEEFDVDDFLVQCGEEFGYPTEDTLQADEIIDSISDYVAELEGRFIDNKSEAQKLATEVVEKLEEEGHTIEGKEALEAVDDDEQTDDEFLSDIGFEPEGSVLMDEGEDTLMDDLLIDPDTNRDVDSDEEEGKEDVLLSADGEEEEEELSPEDVVMPTNPAKDFKNDIGGDASRDDINRILALAGRAKSELPRRPTQP